MMTALLKATRSGAAWVAIATGLALTAACSTDSPIKPSAIDITGPETVAAQSPSTQATTIGFSQFDAATLTVTIATTTTSSVGQPYIDQGKIKLEILVDSTGKPVPCGTVGATYVRFDTFDGGGKNSLAGLISTAVELDDLATTTNGAVKNVACGDQICIRAHYVTGGGATKVATHFSDATPYTVVCSTGCTLSQGYWKNHPANWPANGLTLGTVNYTAAQLEAILQAPVKGNGLISLAHQLIAAKLNVVNGASSSAVASAITAADALIGGLVVPPAGSGSLEPSVTGALTSILDNYNNGVIGPGHCQE